MVDSRAKGATGETKVRDTLRSYTKLQWERVPGSGALDPKHGLKGDLYVPGKVNRYCVEVKNYKDDHLTSKILTSKNPQLIEWWEQTLRESKQVSKLPLLIFKFDRSKLFAAYEEFPPDSLAFLGIHTDKHDFYVSILEDLLLLHSPRFVE
jgi:hypothetical protein